MSENTATRDKFRWAILTLISVSHIIGATAQYGINTLAPFYQEELGLSRAQVGLFFSAFYLAMTGASFGAGWLADRLGIRKTTLQGARGSGYLHGDSIDGTVLRLGLCQFLPRRIGVQFSEPGFDQRRDGMV